MKLEGLLLKRQLSFLRRIINSIINKIVSLLVINYPLKGLTLKFYFGEIEHGVPYFLPRKWVNDEPIPVKIFQFKIIKLGWKCKLDEIRFEYSPMISIVLFGKQMCIWIIPNTNYEELYWEALLTYKLRTKGTKSERLIQLFKKYSCTWSTGEVVTDYYYNILKSKHIKTYNEWIKNNLLII